MSVARGVCVVGLLAASCSQSVGVSDQALACVGADGSIAVEQAHGFAAPVPIRETALGKPIDHTRVVYLNRDARTYVGGIDDAQSGASSVVYAQKLASTTIDEFKQGDAAWSDVRACIRQQFVAFDIAITDIRPVTPNYIEAHFGGDGTELALTDGSGGIAPIDSDHCGVVDGGVVFVFTDLFGDNVRSICEVGAHEIGHVFSLDHELRCQDPMTYLEGCGDKDFQAAEVSCGESTPRACVCNRTTQSSVDVLQAQIGDAVSDTTPPVVQLLDPVVDPSGQGTYVLVRAHDPDAALASVELHVVANGHEQVSICGDATLPCTIDGELASFAVPASNVDLTIWAVAEDTGGNRVATPQQAIRAHSTVQAPLVLAVAPVASAYDQLGVVEIQALVLDKLPLSEVVLVWTDASGDVQEVPLCTRPGSSAGMATTSSVRYGLSMHLGDGALARSFHVRVTDAAGYTVSSVESQVNVTR